MPYQSPYDLSWLEAQGFWIELQQVSPSISESENRVWLTHCSVRDKIIKVLCPEIIKRCITTTQHERNNYNERQDYGKHCALDKLLFRDTRIDFFRTFVASFVFKCMSRPPEYRQQTSEAWNSNSTLTYRH